MAGGKFKIWPIALIVVALVAVGKCGSKDRDSGTASDTTSASRPTATAPAAPSPHRYMPGDGYHNMGGIEGKDWGVWRSAGGSGPCEWSIRLVNPYSGALILEEGTAGPGQPAVAEVWPPGDTSAISGKIDGDMRVVFATHGCGAWKLD